MADAPAQTVVSMLPAIASRHGRISPISRVMDFRIMAADTGSATVRLAGEVRGRGGELVADAGSNFRVTERMRT